MPTHSIARPAPAARLFRRSLALSVVGLSVLAMPAAAKRRPGTQIDSSYGLPSDVGSWQLRAVSSQVVDGVTIQTQVVCPAPDGGIDADNPTLCGQEYIFLYQLPPGLSNVVLTFDGLTGFSFETQNFPQGFGVLLCDPQFDQDGAAMLCTNTSAPDYVAMLGLEFGASAGRLTLFVPAVRDSEPLTFYIREVPPNPPAKLAPPRMSIGRVVIYPPNLRFGSQEVGTVSPPQTIVVSNWTSPAPRLDAPGTMTPAAFPVSGACDALEPGASCVLRARFAPTTGDGQDTTGAVQLLAGATTSIPITGQVTAPGLTIAPSTLTFGSQPLGTSSTSQAVTISRAASATGPFTIAAIAVEPDDATSAPDFAIVSDHCTGTLAPGDSCQFAVAFAPQYPGALTARVTIEDGSSGGHTVALTGMANDSGTATPSVANVAFGAQLVGSASAHRNVHFTRPAPGTQVVAVDATPPFSLVAETCTDGSTSTSCDAEIAFTPPLTGQYTGALSFATTDINGTLVIPLTGSGSDFTVAADPAAATIARGASTRFQVTVASQGGFTGEVQPACSGAPIGSTCQAAPASELLAADGTLVFAFEVATASGGEPGVLRTLGGPRSALCALVGLLVAWRFARSPRRRRRHAALAARLLVVAACAALGSCAASHAEGGAPAGTPAGNFPLTFQIASGTVVRTATAMLTVQ